MDDVLAKVVEFYVRGMPQSSKAGIISNSLQESLPNLQHLRVNPQIFRNFYHSCGVDESLGDSVSSGVY